MAAGLAVDAFMVAGVAWPYIPQMRAMLAAKDASAFSLLTSLVVVVSGTLRVAYWVGERFEAALLVQAVVAVLTQLVMVAVVVHIKQATGKAGVARFTDLSPATFWAWRDLASYLQFEGALVAVLACGQLVAGGLGWYSPTLGALALGIEALLPVPQMLTIFKTRNTGGVSTVMIGAWVAGDALKTVYAVMKSAPLPFVACGLFQLSVDVVLALQLFVLYPPSRTAAARKD